ncbi:MAG: hypothetical protein AAF658_14430, partial [Myxococcota bacterium]
MFPIQPVTRESLVATFTALSEAVQNIPFFRGDSDERDATPPRPVLVRSREPAELRPPGEPTLAAPNLTSAQWENLAELLLEATKRKTNALDLGLFIFFGPFAIPAHRRRLEGRITPTEARSLVEAASQLTPSEQRMLALTLGALVETRVALTVKQRKTLEDETTIVEDSRVILETFFDETYAAHGVPSPSEHAAAAVLASLDTIRVHQNHAVRELRIAAE